MPTILLVDDHPPNVRLLIDLLLGEGYQVMVAESGPSALDRARYRRPDLVLLDVQMGEMDGFATCRQFKADADLADIPIIFLTVADTLIDKQQAFAAGGVDYLTKPIEPAEVLLRVGAQLALQTLRRELAAANGALAETNAQLAARVAARTAALEAEVARRAQSEQEKGVLLATLQAQNARLLADLHAADDETARRRVTVAHELEQRLASDLALARLHAAELNGSGQAAPLLALLDGALALLQTVAFELRAPPPHAWPDGVPPPTLSEREHEILRLLVNQYSTAQIATQLHISDSSVRTYRRRIMAKLDVRTQPDLLRAALRLGLV